MLKDKKKYLNSYLIQKSKIARLNQMIEENPKEKEYYLMKIAACNKKRKMIENKISAVEDELLREILFEKYICSKTLEQISLILNYSKRHIERLHIAALKAFKM